MKRSLMSGPTLSSPAGPIMNYDGLDRSGAISRLEYMLGINFPNMIASTRNDLVASLKDEEIGYILQFFPSDYHHGAEKELFLALYTDIIQKTRQKYEDVIEKQFYKNAHDREYMLYWNQKPYWKAEYLRILENIKNPI